MNTSSRRKLLLACGSPLLFLASFLLAFLCLYGIGVPSGAGRRSAFLIIAIWSFLPGFLVSPIVGVAFVCLLNQTSTGRVRVLVAVAAFVALFALITLPPLFVQVGFLPLVLPTACLSSALFVLALGLGAQMWTSKQKVLI